MLYIVRCISGKRVKNADVERGGFSILLTKIYKIFNLKAAVSTVSTCSLSFYHTYFSIFQVDT